MPTPTLPLETRLKSIQAASPNFLAAFEVFTEDFFLALDTAFNAGGIPFLWRIYEDHVRCYADSMSPPVRAEMVAVADRLPADEGDTLLYHILIDPFTYAKGGRP